MLLTTVMCESACRCDCTCSRCCINTCQVCVTLMKEPAAAAAAAAGGGGGDDATVPMTVATTHLSHLRTHTHTLSLLTPPHPFQSAVFPLLSSAPKARWCAVNKVMARTHCSPPPPPPPRFDPLSFLHELTSPADVVINKS